MCERRTETWRKFYVQCRLLSRTSCSHLHRLANVTEDIQTLYIVRAIFAISALMFSTGSTTEALASPDGWAQSRSSAAPRLFRHEDALFQLIIAMIKISFLCITLFGVNSGFMWAVWPNFSNNFTETGRLMITMQVFHSQKFQTE